MLKSCPNCEANTIDEDAPRSEASLVSPIGSKVLIEATVVAHNIFPTREEGPTLPVPCVKVRDGILFGVCCDKLRTTEVPAEHFKSLWDDSCKAVAELCDLAGAKPDDIHDVWTLKILLEEILSERQELRDLSVYAWEYIDETVQGKHASITDPKRRFDCFNAIWAPSEGDAKTSGRSPNPPDPESAGRGNAEAANNETAPLADRSKSAASSDPVAAAPSEAEHVRRAAEARAYRRAMGINHADDDAGAADAASPTTAASEARYDALGGKTTRERVEQIRAEQSDGEDPLTELAKLLESAGAVVYLHDRDCATWQKPPGACDKECGKRAYAKRDAKDVGEGRTCTHWWRTIEADDQAGQELVQCRRCGVEQMHKLQDRTTEATPYDASSAATPTMSDHEVASSWIDDVADLGIIYVEHKAKARLAELIAHVRAEAIEMAAKECEAHFASQLGLTVYEDCARRIRTMLLVGLSRAK